MWDALEDEGDLGDGTPPTETPRGRDGHKHCSPTNLSPSCTGLQNILTCFLLFLPAQKRNNHTKSSGSPNLGPQPMRALQVPNEEVLLK